ncbi:hypothetical protein P5673_021008 [Acropora cervicornis]|uniref:Uncharacterized protein n=1 Tax=Acropora cervicornis TaxID=6130 RepID=A0AAD9V0K8_ACRCE|nr:hypothetical protein P5673_021008 [Acropora cervicornis]
MRGYLFQYGLMKDFTLFTSLVINDKLLCVTVEITSEDITNTDRVKDFVFTSNLSKMEVFIRLNEARADFAHKLSNCDTC